ncbi:MAG TPA: hypothetical protein VLY86_04575 [Methanothrix sp.]|nr:hypothetical protein [Methanothrix sp.]
MKGAICVLSFLVAASVLTVAAATIENPSVDKLWPQNPDVSPSSANTKSLEDKFAEALQALKASREAGSENRADALKADGPLAGPGEKGLNNSSSNAAMLNSSNSSALAPLVNNSGIGTIDAAPLSNGSEQQRVGARSMGSFQGFYGLTASRHEIGKSDIRSRMLLSGDFDVDKTVSFTDQGV